LFATEGKGADCIEKIGTYLESKDVESKQIEQICIDMSPSFISGCKSTFKNAAVTFDKFHVTQEVNKAMDALRLQERKQAQLLSGNKYLFLKNSSNLHDYQINKRNHLLEIYPSIGEGYRLKEMFADFWNMNNKEEAGAFLAFWCDQVQESNIEPFIKAANTIKNH